MHFISVLSAASPSVSQGPWWATSTIALVSVLLGIGIKWAADAFHTRGRDRRENKLRFIQDKRVAYADFLAACEQVADGEHDHRLLLAKGRLMDDSGSDDDADIDDFNADRERLVARRDEAYLAVTRAHSIVQLIAPAPVVATADLLAARSHHPHLYGPRIAAEREYVDAARADLGYSSTSHLSYINYESYIEYDDPRSGVDASEWTVKPT